MRKFLASFWFPFLVSLVLAGVTAGAYAALAPSGEAVGNAKIVEVFTIVGWAAGPVVGLLTLILIGILNLVRRLLKLRRKAPLHPVVVLLGVAPWLAFSWAVTEEPPYTSFARAAIEFVGRPMLWGALVATLLTLVLSIPLAFSRK